MIIEFTCPYCREELDADLEEESEIRCPVCFKLLTVPASIIKEQMDDRLLDPSDPAGYFNNFPLEDDY